MILILAGRAQILPVVGLAHRDNLLWRLELVATATQRSIPCKFLLNGPLPYDSVRALFV